MEQRMEDVYYGIDINERYTMLSFYQKHTVLPNGLDQPNLRMRKTYFPIILLSQSSGMTI